jgi:hypothetical protein
VTVKWSMLLGLAFFTAAAQVTVAGTPGYAAERRVEADIPPLLTVKCASALQARSLFVVCEVDCAVATVSTVRWCHFMCGQFAHASIRHHSIILVR